MLKSSEWIYVILLQEELEMEEFQLHLHVAQEALQLVSVVV